MEYLRRLEEATKLKKPRKSAKPVRLAKKEAGFDLHWAGANRQRTGGKLKKAARPLAALAPPENARRTWGRTAAPGARADEIGRRVFARTVVPDAFKQAARAKAAADDDVVEATPEAAPVEAPPGPPRGAARGAPAARRDVAIGGVADEPGALGARSIEVEVDGALVFAGELPRRARDAKGSGWFDVALTAPAAVPAELAAAAPTPAAEAAPTPAEEAPPAPKPAPLEAPGGDGRGGRRARPSDALGAAPRELPRRKPRNEASLLESWDSLAQFSSKSRSRLARAGASALGDSFADSVAGAPGDADSFVEDDDDEVFEGVPTLPSGRVLTVQILSTWGDPHYVGLHGLELFDDRGAPVAPVAIAATPSMEGHDPRTPENLCDGVTTLPTSRAWLCPFDAAEPPTVTLELAPASQPPTTLAMLRLWNYNASRTASTRGARFLRCFLDGVKIFEGEVRQAPGTLEDCRDEAECVLFTYDAGVLATIEGRDDAAAARRKAEKDEEDEALDRLLEVARPSTADRLEDSVADEAPVVARDAGERPAGAGVVCRRLRLRLAATWGDAHWVGLTGLRVLGERGPVELDFSKIAATPRDLKSLGHAGDPRTLDKLFDGCHATRDDAHMWLVPFDGATKPVVDVDLGAPTRVFGLEVHNYNKSPEDALRGARTLVVEADGAPLRTVELRPAPGRAVDFGQLVSFDEPPAKPPGPLRVRPPVRGAVLADYETPLLPRGSLLRFVIHSSWGDPYYVGLDGIRLVGEDGREIPVDARRVDAVPRSVRVLGAGFADDARLPANLFSGKRGVPWLAPNLCSYAGEAQLPEENELFVFLDAPRRLAGVALTNYAKTPSRGVRELSLFVDGVLVSRNVLKRADEVAPGEAQHVLFTHDRHDRRPANVEPQDVLCIDENQVRVRSKAMFEPDRALGKFETVDLAARPATSVVR
ncbi:DUF4457-containing protein [Aureococcus anophagefferens]|nr:DUF4457-containing protein [Aureococcus anophagefferens]